MNGLIPLAQEWVSGKRMKLIPSLSVSVSVSVSLSHTHTHTHTWSLALLPFHRGMTQHEDPLYRQLPNLQNRTVRNKSLFFIKYPDSGILR
jgi:hypothetical protein